jgi:hypothetical protein
MSVHQEHKKGRLTQGAIARGRADTTAIATAIILDLFICGPNTLSVLKVSQSKKKKHKLLTLMGLRGCGWSWAAFALRGFVFGIVSPIDDTWKPLLELWSRFRPSSNLRNAREGLF